MRSLIVPSTGMRNGRGSHSVGGGTSGIVSHCPPVERPVPEGRVDGQDLAVADVAHGPGLGDLVSFDRDA